MTDQTPPPPSWCDSTVDELLEAIEVATANGDRDKVYQYQLVLLTRQRPDLVPNQA